MNRIKLAAGLTFDSVVDGPGLRTVIWTQGCPHNCPECHNPGTHSFNEGEWWELDEIISSVIASNKDVTFSGGDPFCQPHQCALIAKAVNANGHKCWGYTGYIYEQLIEMSKLDNKIMDFLKELDVLVDGPFIINKRTLTLPFRGSSNQRIIDVQASLKAGKCIEAKIPGIESIPSSHIDGIFL